MQESVGPARYSALRDTCLQVDPHEALVASLKREVQLLRAENAYFRNQVLSSTNLKALSAALL